LQVGVYGDAIDIDGYARARRGQQQTTASRQRWPLQRSSQQGQLVP
jgi:hypothetical protein